MAKKDEKLKGEVTINELENSMLVSDSELDLIASMPIEDVDEELRQMGIDPDEPLPLRMTQLISRNDSIASPRMAAEAQADKLPIKILVVGVGSAGGNVISRMMGSSIKGVEFVAVNTDVQALNYSHAPKKIQIGGASTKGRGAGGDPIIGLKAALECTERLFEILEGADLVFLTAGLGGGTGTGALPVIASLAKELGALTVAVVTKPFQFEGRRRMRIAEEGLNELSDSADTVIAIPNEMLVSIAGKNASLFNSFKIADEVLHQAVQGIIELITVPGYINLDFADVKTTMIGMGLAWMGVGRASGEKRALVATQQVISSPLLEETAIKRAKGVLINITGGPDLTLEEVNEASSLISQAVDKNANIIFGTVIDENLADEIRITVIATGFDKEAEAIETISVPVEQASPAPPRYAAPASDLSVPRMDVPARTEQLNIPTYIRKRASK
jgi:cell division protein FtsZ